MGARKLLYHFPFLQGYKEINTMNTGLPNRHESINEYRYGFQGQEKDDEIKGEGNSYDFGARIYDSRVGRWWSIDKYSTKFLSVSPYAFAVNKPIIYIDIDGNDIEPTIKFIIDKQGEETSQVWIYGAGNEIIYGKNVLTSNVVKTKNGTIKVQAESKIYMSYQFYRGHPAFNEYRAAGKKSALLRNTFKMFKRRVKEHEKMHAQVWANAHNTSRTFIMDIENNSDYSGLGFFIDDASIDFNGTTEEILNQVYTTTTTYNAVLATFENPTEEDIKYAEDVAFSTTQQVYEDINDEVRNEIGSGMGEEKVRELTRFDEELMIDYIDEIKPYDERSGALIQAEIDNKESKTRKASDEK